MTRILLGSLLVVGLVASGSPARAQDEDPMHRGGGLGFHNSDAPLGLRWWFSGQRVALDAGLGFSSEEVGDENLKTFTIDLGVPILLKSWDRFHFMVRPGFLYQTEDELVGPDVESRNTWAVTGELEGEVFLVDNVSFSASHGIAIVNTDPPVGDSTTDFTTLGNNFTEIGFHVYLFGSSE